MTLLFLIFTILYLFFLKISLNTHYFPVDKRICLTSVYSFFLYEINNVITLFLVQITVAESHSVKRKGLVDIIKIVKNSFSVFDTLLVFLTPPFVYDKWEFKQKVDNNDKTESKSFDCEQEVWCLTTSRGKKIWDS